MGQTVFTYTITPEQGETLRAHLLSTGFDLAELAHGHFAARKGKCSIQYYHSNKLVLQGKEAAEFVEFYLEPEILKEARLGYENLVEAADVKPHIGVDETGKGDFFGPLVVAGAFVDAECAGKLRELGVCDSKSVKSDKRAMELASGIGKILGPRQEVIQIFPSRYNELYADMKNLNRLLAWAHIRVMANLKERFPAAQHALSDQFAAKGVLERELKKRHLDLELEQRHRAEDDVAVAAASLIARAGFLRGLKRLSDEAGYELKKGAGSGVKELARQMAREKGEAFLATYTKTHFKTFAEVLAEKT